MLFYGKIKGVKILLFGLFFKILLLVIFKERGKMYEDYLINWSVCIRLFRKNGCIDCWWEDFGCRRIVRRWLWRSRSRRIFRWGESIDFRFYWLLFLYFRWRRRRWLLKLNIRSYIKLIDYSWCNDSCWLFGNRWRRLWYDCFD